MWTITNIERANHGEAERLPGEPVMMLVTIENEAGEESQFECGENWLQIQDIGIGDEWPEDIEAMEADQDRLNNMSAWMDNYYDALDEME